MGKVEGEKRNNLIFTLIPYSLQTDSANKRERMDCLSGFELSGIHKGKSKQIIEKNKSRMK